MMGCLFGKSKLPLVGEMEIAGPPKSAMEARGFSYDPDVPQLDITAPTSEVQIELDLDRGVLYVHVGPVTVLRICQIKESSCKIQHVGGS
jgi:hypothetical protein